MVEVALNATCTKTNTIVILLQSALLEWFNGAVVCDK